MASWWWFLGDCFGRSQVIEQQDPGHIYWGQVSGLATCRDWKKLLGSTGIRPCLGCMWKPGSCVIRSWVAGAWRQYLVSNVLCQRKGEESCSRQLRSFLMLVTRGSGEPLNVTGVPSAEGVCVCPKLWIKF